MSRPRCGRRPLALVLAALAALAVLLAVAARTREAEAPPALRPGAPATLAGDPLAWTPARSAEYARRARAGLAHVLHAKSPGGAVASAERTAAWRPRVEAAARSTGQEPDTLEAIVLLESAGSPEARASDDLEGAVGLTQILAGTGRDLLGLRVDVAASRRLARRIARAERRGDARRAARLRAERRRVDQRYDPDAALAATGRYLALARARLGRDDLAVTSYHMGIGNLETALARFGAGTIPYARLFFASTPERNPRAWRFLASLGDDSSTYLWRVEAAREIMRLLREDRAELVRRDRLQTARASAELLLHPPGEPDAYADPDALGEAYDEGELVPLPTAWLARHGVRPDPGMGALAGEIGAERERYRGLRRPALATLAYVGARVRALSGVRAPLTVTSTVRDERYQAALVEREVQATTGRSLHTTGFSFDVARRYASPAQARAFQFVLDRLTALHLIAWAREPGAIHVTVASDAARLERPLGVQPGT